MMKFDFKKLLDSFGNDFYDILKLFCQNNYVDSKSLNDSFNGLDLGSYYINEYMQIVSNEDHSKIYKLFVKYGLNITEYAGDHIDLLIKKILKELNTEKYELDFHSSKKYILNKKELM